MLARITLVACFHKFCFFWLQILETMPMTEKVEELLHVIGPFYEIVEDKKSGRNSDLTSGWTLLLSFKFSNRYITHALIFICQIFFFYFHMLVRLEKISKCLEGRNDEIYGKLLFKIYMPKEFCTNLYNLWSRHSGVFFPNNALHKVPKYYKL